MMIEKMSKYVLVNEHRRVLISLPRVKWLEAQPDYEPWPPLEEPPPEPIVDFQPTRYTLRPQARSHDLSPRQKHVWAMHREGKSNKEIAEALQSTPNAIGKLLAQAREKLGIGLE